VGVVQNTCNAIAKHEEKYHKKIALLPLVAGGLYMKGGYMGSIR